MEKATTRKHHDNNAGAACQVEKVDHATALQMTKTLGSIKQVGTSLGSFSLTASLLSALLNEFSSELSKKQGQLDSDPHWWMPMTLPLDAYVQLMGRKGTSEKEASEHYARIQKLLKWREYLGQGLANSTRETTNGAQK